MRPLGAIAALGLFFGPCAAQAGEDSIDVFEAWVPGSGAGKDVALSMTVRNAGPEDALLRARCTAANFAEDHAVDHGEGFPAMRVVRSIPIAADGATRMTEDTGHVMLLQTIHPLVDGESFPCRITFRGAGPQDVTVMVGRPK